MGSHYWQDASCRNKHNARCEYYATQRKNATLNSDSVAKLWWRGGRISGIMNTMFTQESSASLLGLESGKDIRNTADAADEPLHDASYAGNTDEVQRLLDQGYDINAKDEAGATPLHYAASGGHLETVDLLLNRGANVHAQGHLGYTPLHLAYFNGHLQVIESLINHGADPSIISTLDEGIVDTEDD